MITGYKKNSPATAKGYIDAPEDMPETFSLDEDDLKEVKSWKVGKTYDLCMTVKMTGQRQDSMDKTVRGTFDIIDVQVDDGEDNTDDN
jgi:hypothetical protein